MGGEEGGHEGQVEGQNCVKEVVELGEALVGRYPISSIYGLVSVPFRITQTVLFPILFQYAAQPSFSFPRKE